MTSHVDQPWQDAERKLLDGQYVESEATAVAAGEAVLASGPTPWLDRLIYTLQEARRQRRMDALDGRVWFDRPDCDEADWIWSVDKGADGPAAVALCGIDAQARHAVAHRARERGGYFETLCYRPGADGGVEVAWFADPDQDDPNWAPAPGVSIPKEFTGRWLIEPKELSTAGHLWMRLQEAGGDAVQADVEVSPDAGPAEHFATLWRAAMAAPSHEKLHHALANAARRWMLDEGAQ
ncbi:MAG: hypothetical protein AAF288_00135 [Planctomycetota bacterium]